jgi:hypothetical protein
VKRREVVRAATAGICRRVAARYEAALADPELLSIRDGVALLQGAIGEIKADLKDAESRPDLDAILGSVETSPGAR